MKEFNWPVRVYYEDTDAAGVVYHSNYLKYMERARTEWLREFGFSHDELRKQQKIIFVIREMSMKFLRPARFDELLLVTAKLVQQRGASLLFEQSIEKGEELVCTASVNIACLDAATLKPQRIPESIQAELKP